MAKKELKRRVLQCKQVKRAEWREEFLTLADNQLLICTEYASLKHGTEMHKILGSGPFVDRDLNIKTRLFEAVENSKPSFPTDIGIISIGKVVDVGDNVDKGWLDKQVSLRAPIADYHVAEPKQVSILDDLPPEQELLRDPMQFALGAVLEADVRAGQTVLITGAGAIGLLAVQLCKERGATVILSSSMPHRREVALRLGADVAMDSSHLRDIARELKQFHAVEGRTESQCGACVSIETSGKYRNLHICIRATRQGGQVITVGYYDGGASDICLGEEFFHNSLSVKASLPAFRWKNSVCGTIFPKDLAEMVTTKLRSGAIKSDGILSFIDPADAVDAISDLVNDPGQYVKLVVDYRHIGPSERETASQQEPEQHPLRTAVIGAGQQGCKRIAAIVGHVPQLKLTRVVDVADKTLADAKKRFYAKLPNTIWSLNPNDVIEDEQIDVVIVATPSHLHEDIAIESRKRGKHVLVEKPLGADLAASVRIATAQTDEPVPEIKVGFNYAYRDSARAAIAVFKEALIGEVLHLRASIGHAQFVGSQGSPRTRNFLENSGSMIDLGIHAIDLGRVFLPELTKAYGFVTKEKLFPELEVDEIAMGVFSTKDGRTMSVTSSFVEHRPWMGLRFEVLGSEGRIVFSMAPNTIEIMLKNTGSGDAEAARALGEARIRNLLNKYGVAEPKRFETQVLQRPDPPLTYTSVELEFGREDLSLAHELQEFATVIRNGQSLRGPFYRDANDCITAQRLIEAAQKSARQDGAMLPTHYHVKPEVTA